MHSDIHAKDPRCQKSFSIVIPAYNEEDSIGKCLASICHVNFPVQAFEVIVVDNGSTDRTVEMATSFADRLNLKILQKRDCHISAVRNFGAARAEGTYLAFLDADMLVGQDWMARAMSHLSTDGAGIIGGTHRIPENSTWVVRAWFQERLAERQGHVSYVSSGNLLMSRANFILLGGFDEGIETNEDCDLCYRAQAAGLPVLSLPEISAVHLGFPSTLLEFFRKEQWHGKSVFSVFLRNVRALQNVRAVSFGGYYLLCIAAVLLGLAVAAFSRDFITLSLALLAAIFPPLVLSAVVSIRQRRLALWLQLTVLYLVYGVARGVCLLDVRTWARQ